MNSGLSQKFATLRWQGNVVTGESFFNVPLRAELKLTPEGKAESLTVTRVGAETPPRTFERWYDYHRQFPNWPLPTRIHENDFKLEVLSVELSDKPMPRSWFSCERFLNRDSRILVMIERIDGAEVANRPYDDLADGATRLFGIWFPKRQLRPAFFCASVLVTSIILFLVVKARKTKVQTQLTRTTEKTE